MKISIYLGAVANKLRERLAGLSWFGFYFRGSDAKGRTYCML